MDKWYYTSNKDFIDHPINKTFAEVVTMTQPQFAAWVEELKDVILQFWENGNPPRMGFSETEMVEQVHELRNFDVESIYHIDENTGKKDVLKTSTRVGNFVNQFYPTMYKTKIDSDKSIYDYFANPKLQKSRYSRCERHFKKDGFYVYSHIVRCLEKEVQCNPENFLIPASSGVEWITKFESNLRNDPLYKQYDYWLCPIDVNNENSMEYTGNAIDKYSKVRSFTLTKEDLAQLPIPEHCLVTTRLVEKKAPKENKLRKYHIRLYKKDVKIFPLGFKSIRMSYSQYAVNFPPVIAKAIYKRYTKSGGIVWDCSAGWGGRLAGALTAEHKLHYIGNDPNTDHRTTNGRTKYHELGDYIKNIIRTNNTFECYEECSELMHTLPEFQKYKGKLDLVFTSPPYFCKEVYSQDPTQSALKFKQYEEWKNGFLFPTLKTAYEWLKPGGILAWNIADVYIRKHDPDSRLPLEDDTTKYLQSLGFEHQENLKIAMQLMQGSNRYDSDKKRTFLHICTVKNKDDENKDFKFEYLFVYKKPLT